MYNTTYGSLNSSDVSWWIREGSSTVAEQRDKGKRGFDVEDRNV